MITVITVLTLTIIILATLLILETTKTNTSGDLIEQLIIDESEVKYNQEVSRSELSELSTFLRDHDFYFTNVLEIYDDNNEDIIYQIEYRYNSNDEIVISNIE
ncbi:hypothetical protein SAMN05421734_102345 [Pelagirhabdus alkalitolerans]|uniref:Uncharacterized protein n=1 Tax=Pelagirhabdus alkalitolerans TaxID=1612202 RepID=A0A1G6H7Q7_9BACI|nr:hypothetical protein [Pelagirhabdus alkalitolerans]SDB90319.1 hypothetical protein SAMN05421734_102345 [Pelagirhabdus alkalitolerans]